MSRPAKLPRWGDVSGAITEPPEAKKDIGTEVEIPPLDYENWREDLQNQWIKHFAETQNTPVVTPAGGLVLDVSAGRYPIVTQLQVASATQVGGVATVQTVNPHGFLTGQFQVFVGANEVDYNVGGVVTVTGTFTFTFPINPAAPATATPDASGLQTRLTSDLNLLAPFAGGQVTINPTTVPANEVRIDAIVIEPQATNVDNEGLLVVKEGTPEVSINAARPPLILENEAVVGYVVVVLGMTEITSADIVTNFDPYAVRKDGNNRLYANTFQLEAPLDENPNGQCFYSAAAGGSGEASYLLINNGILRGRVGYSSVFARVWLLNEVGNDSGLAINDDGALTYSDKVYPAAAAPVPQLAANISVNETASTNGNFLGLSGDFIAGGIDWIGRENVVTRAQTNQWQVWQLAANSAYYLTVPSGYLRSDFVYVVQANTLSGVVDEEHSIMKVSNNTDDGTLASIVIGIGRQNAINPFRDGNFTIQVYRVKL